MAAKTLLLKLSRFIDSAGMESWIEIRPDVAELLAETEPKLKERLLKVPENIAKVADRSYGNSEWAFKLKFRWLVGESRTWGGEVALWRAGLVEGCPICKDAELPTYAYCLCCDRSGRDGEIRRGEEKKAAAPRFRPRGKGAT